MKPICVPCQRFYRCKHNEHYFIEGMPGPEWDGMSGKDSPGWLPYKVWLGDLWECPGCGHQTVSGIGRNRVAEHYESEFAIVIKRTGASQLFIKDC